MVEEGLKRMKEEVARQASSLHGWRLYQSTSMDVVCKKHNNPSFDMVLGLKEFFFPALNEFPSATGVIPRQTSRAILGRVIDPTVWFTLLSLFRPVDVLAKRRH